MMYSVSRSSDEGQLGWAQFIPLIMDLLSKSSESSKSSGKQTNTGGGLMDMITGLFSGGGKGEGASATASAAPSTAKMRLLIQQELNKRMGGGQPGYTTPPQASAYVAPTRVGTVTSQTQCNAVQPGSIFSSKYRICFNPQYDNEETAAQRGGWLPVGAGAPALITQPTTGACPTGFHAAKNAAGQTICVKGVVKRVVKGKKRGKGLAGCCLGVPFTPHEESNLLWILTIIHLLGGAVWLGHLASR